jgi:hypothetical protein
VAHTLVTTVTELFWLRFYACGHFDFNNVWRTVKLHPLDTEEYFEIVPKPFSFRIVEGKSHIAILLNGQSVNLKTASTMGAVSVVLKCWRQRNVGVQNCTMLCQCYDSLQIEGGERTEHFEDLGLGESNVHRLIFMALLQNR